MTGPMKQEPVNLLQFVRRAATALMMNIFVMNRELSGGVFGTEAFVSWHRLHYFPYPPLHSALRIEAPPVA